MNFWLEYYRIWCRKNQNKLTLRPNVQYNYAVNTACVGEKACVSMPILRELCDSSGQCLWRKTDCCFFTVHTTSSNWNEKKTQTTCYLFGRFVVSASLCRWPTWVYEITLRVSFLSHYHLIINSTQQTWPISNPERRH